MIPQVVAAEPLDGYRIRLTFDDGVVGEVNVRALVAFTGVFAALRDPAAFRKVRVDAEAGTVTWPGGADLDPLVLYAHVRGIAVEELLAERRPATS